MGALCVAGVGRGTEKEKLLLPLDGGSERDWPEDQMIGPSSPPSLHPSSLALSTTGSLG